MYYQDPELNTWYSVIKNCTKNMAKNTTKLIELSFLKLKKIKKKLYFYKQFSYYKWDSATLKQPVCLICFVFVTTDLWKCSQKFLNAEGGCSGVKWNLYRKSGLTFIESRFVFYSSNPITTINLQQSSIYPLETCCNCYRF